jgi:predicted DNA-binding ArsR family transcriptional regulator
VLIESQTYIPQVLSYYTDQIDDEKDYYNEEISKRIERTINIIGDIFRILNIDISQIEGYVKDLKKLKVEKSKTKVEEWIQIFTQLKE